MTTVETRTSNPRMENESKATIYIRNYAKKAIMLQLPSRIKVAELKDKIQRRMRVPQEDQILFLHGNQIGANQEDIELENKYIFHLVNIKRTTLHNISISVKRIEPNRPIHRFTVAPSMKISDFMATSFHQTFGDMENYFLVYTGREIQSYNTFAAEFVEDQSELLAVHKIENLKGEYVERKTEEETTLQQKPMMFVKKQSLSVEASSNTQGQGDKNFGKIEQQKNTSAAEIKQQQKKDKQEGEQQGKQKQNDEENDESLTEDIVIDYQQKYSVISKGSFCKQNQNFHKKLRSNYSSRPARQNDRRRDRSSSPKLHQKLEKVAPQKDEEEEKNKQEEEQEDDEEEYRDKYLSENYYSHSHDKSEAHDRSGVTPLGLTVISSRHDEEQSLNEDMFKSSLAGKGNMSVKVDKHNETDELGGKNQEQKKNEKEEQKGQSIQYVLTKSSQKDVQHEQQVSKDLEKQKMQEINQSNGEEPEMYGRTNIFEYIEEEQLLQKDEIREKSNTVEHPQQNCEQKDKSVDFSKEIKIPHLEIPQISEGQLDNSQSGFLKKLEISQQDQDLLKSTKKTPKAKSVKSNNSESMLLETSQDVNDDNLFSGRFAWGTMKNEKAAIDLSAQLQEEANYNEIIPGGNTKHWDHLSFSFRNNQPLELKAGDLIMIGNENALQVEGLQDSISELFIEKLAKQA